VRRRTDRQVALQLRDDLTRTSRAGLAYSYAISWRKLPDGLTAKTDLCLGSRPEGGLQNQPAMRCEESKLQSYVREHDDADWSEPELRWRIRRFRYDAATDPSSGFRGHCARA
jgi:hypothetical protein